MNDMNHTTRAGDNNDADIPVLTDIIDDAAHAATTATPAPMTASVDHHIAPPLPSLQQIEAELTARLNTELAMQIPVLLEAALREHLPRAIGAKLQAELLSVLANALPGAAQNAAAELSSTLAFEVGGLLEQRLEEEVRRAVSDEIARISTDHQIPR
ncbi:MAG: hypothetical protein RI928_1030 [Pseudomonadota bacterium]|jgi:hypothetical protein